MVPRLVIFQQETTLPTQGWVCGGGIPGIGQELVGALFSLGALAVTLKGSCPLPPWGRVGAVCGLASAGTTVTTQPRRPQGTFHQQLLGCQMGARWGGQSQRKWPLAGWKRKAFPSKAGGWTQGHSGRGRPLDARTTGYTHPAPTCGCHLLRLMHTPGWRRQRPRGPVRPGEALGDSLPEPPFPGF